MKRTFVKLPQQFHHAKQVISQGLRVLEHSSSLPLLVLWRTAERRTIALRLSAEDERIILALKKRTGLTRQDVILSAILSAFRWTGDEFTNITSFLPRPALVNFANYGRLHPHFTRKNNRCPYHGVVCGNNSVCHNFLITAQFLDLDNNAKMEEGYASHSPVCPGPAPRRASLVDDDTPYPVACAAE
ncbi:hypothetical protein [Magnetospira sp. QH-2]|uniref:hypothetical protein n=1 Tax=Magnetospira sp. (strain QH-2) TaxID=1288970 RepID=UPI0011DD8170|nr:hypothetical protein [Magnetospira sp. QH-2]